MSDLHMIDLDQEDQIERIAKEIMEEEKHTKSHADLMKDEKKPVKKRKKWNPVALILLCGTLCGLTGTVYFYAMYQNEKGKVEAAAKEVSVEVADSQEDSEKIGEEMYQNGYEDGVLMGEEQKLASLKEEFRSTVEEESMIQALRNLYPECVVFYDTEGYLFRDIDESLGLHSYEEEQFVFQENGFIDYVENGEVTSLRGIDVSKYNEKVDWLKVKESGIDFAFVRVGFRGYGSGDIVLDDMFESHITGAKKAGLKVGVYFFTEAINTEEAQEEAQFVLDQLEEAGVSIDYPIVYDIEKVNVKSARAENLSIEERTDITIAFCEKIKEAGYQPMIYGNIKCFMNMIDISRLKEYPKWYAFYDDFIYYPYELACWQYSDKGSVEGISGEVDLNILFNENFFE